MAMMMTSEEGFRQSLHKFEMGAGTGETGWVKIGYNCVFLYDFSYDKSSKTSCSTFN
jgi:hypothetical protein